MPGCPGAQVPSAAGVLAPHSPAPSVREPFHLQALSRLSRVPLPTPPSIFQSRVVQVPPFRACVRAMPALEVEKTAFFPCVPGLPAFLISRPPNTAVRQTYIFPTFSCRSLLTRHIRPPLLSGTIALDCSSASTPRLAIIILITFASSRSRIIGTLR